MSNKDDFKDLSPKEKLQAENELLKLKLQAEFGMGKMETSLSEEAESEWLKHVYNFEKQFSEGKRCKIYDFLGRPKFKTANQLKSEEIPIELERLTEIMQSNGIELGTCCDYEDEVIYRFITEELFEKETDDMHIPGMMHCFIYEEFHPNHEHDIREHANEFIEFLISKKWDDNLSSILSASTISYNNNFYDEKAFSKIIKVFQSELGKMDLLKWEINSVSFDLETGTGLLEGAIEYNSVKFAKVFNGNVCLEFKLEYDFWSINKVVIPGFSK